MKLTDKEKEICRKYSARDKYGYVHCYMCPLIRHSDVSDCTCKANAHYDEKEKTWIPDFWERSDEL